MTTFTSLPDSLTEVDVIIAGGGTAACVVASRLSDASPSLSILVIEAGPDSAHDPAVRVPVLSFSNTLPTSKNTLFYEGVPEPTIGDRRIVVPAGGTLGGGSAINLSTYSRAQRTDFDAWKTPGWGANDLLPLMKRVETYHGVRCRPVKVLVRGRDKDEGRRTGTRQKSA